MSGIEELAWINGLRSATEIIDETARYWPEDMFGPDLTSDEWKQVRAAGIPTERIASECYRHALGVVRARILEAAAELTEDYEDDHPRPVCGGPR